MKAMLLPLENIPEVGFDDYAALLLTLSRQEAEEIMAELLPSTWSRKSLPRSARRLYEVLQIIAHKDPEIRRRGRDFLNTEGRHRMGRCDERSQAEGGAPGVD